MKGSPARLGFLAALSLAQSLPLALTAFALPVILRREGLSLEAVGLATLLLWPASLRFLAGPMIDVLQARPRPRWMLTELLAVAAAMMLAILLLPPDAELAGMVVAIGVANIVAIVLEVAIDGLVIRSMKPEERIGAGAARFAAAYGGSIVAGGLFLVVESRWGWANGVGLLLAIVVAALLLSVAARPNALKCVSAPRRVVDYVPGRKLALPLLVALLLDLPQNVAIGMTGPMLLDVGFDQARIGILSGGMGLAAAMAGAVAAWRLTPRNQHVRGLVLFALLQALLLLPLAWLAASSAPSLLMAGLAVCGAYAAAAAFNVLLFAWCVDRSDPATGATDLALLASVHSLSYVISGPVGGMVATELGYAGLFVAGAAVAIIVVLAFAGLVLGRNGAASVPRSSSP